MVGLEAFLDGRHLARLRVRHLLSCHLVSYGLQLLRWRVAGPSLVRDRRLAQSLGHFDKLVLDQGKLANVAIAQLLKVEAHVVKRLVVTLSRLLLCLLLDRFKGHGCSFLGRVQQVVVLKEAHDFDRLADGQNLMHQRSQEDRAADFDALGRLAGTSRAVVAVRSLIVILVVDQEKVTKVCSHETLTK